MTRPAGHEAVPITIPPAEKLPEVRAGKNCTCWGAPGLLDQPCTPDTCDLQCKACAAAERPFHTREDLRFLEDGTGSTADTLRRLWAAKDVPKGGPPPRDREPLLVCGRGHSKEPGRDCRECLNLSRRARYARQHPHVRPRNQGATP